MSSYNKQSLVLLLFLLALSLTYLWDAYTASNEIKNLILILPVTLIILVLGVFEVIQHLKQSQPDTAENNKVDDKENLKPILQVILLFTFYVISLPWLGFDVGTFLFIGVFLWLQGERRLLWLAGYPLLFSLLVSYFFSQMLPYPMPMLILPTDY